MKDKLKFLLPQEDDDEEMGKTSDIEGLSDDEVEYSNMNKVKEALSGKKQKLSAKRHKNMKGALSGKFKRVSEAGPSLLSKETRKMDKKPSLDKPLPKLHSDQNTREVAWVKVTDEVGEWSDVVQSRRDAPQLVFPLPQAEVTYKGAQKYNAILKPLTKLELALDKLQHPERYEQKEVVKDKLTEAADKALDIEEAIQRHKDVKKARDLIFQQKMKGKRQNKIKSKKYHKILKKQANRKREKEIEKLRLIDPVLAAKMQQEDSEMKRIQERATLKHKNTGKWAKETLRRSKYDAGAREKLNDQMQLAKELTEKHQTNESEEESDGSGDEVESLNNTDSEDEAVSDEADTTAAPEDASVFEEESKRTLGVLHSMLKLSQKSPVETPAQGEPQSKKAKLQQQETPKVIALESAATPYAIDEYEEDYEADDTTVLDCQIDSFLQGIRDDQKEFEEEKKAVEEAEKLEDINGYLPGWNENFTGNGTKQNRRKAKRLLIRAPTKPKRSESHVIHYEAPNTIGEHQVQDVFYPFKSVSAYERTISQPTGRNYIPENSFLKTIQPRIVTKKGQIIKPLSAEAFIASRKQPNRSALSFK